MARHLFIGNGVAASAFSAGLAADKSIALQTEDGALMIDAATFAASKTFRVVQGTAGANIVSPWINGKNIISVTATPAVAAAVNTATVTAVTTSNAKGVLDLKFVRKGGETPDFFHLSVSIASGANVTASGVAINAAYNAATKPNWLAAASSPSSGAVTFSGVARVDDGMEVPSIFDVIVVESTVGATTFTAANNVAKAAPGSGVGYDVLKLEKEHQGINSGFYNRIYFPNAPATTADVAAAYDIITIVATKDGSTTSSINGVDNLIQIDIAMKDVTGSDVVLDALQTKLNAYTATLGFAAVDGGA